MNKLLKQSLLLTSPIIFLSYSSLRTRTKLYQEEKNKLQNTNEQVKPINKLDEIYNKYLHIAPDVLKYGAFYKKPTNKTDPDEELYRVIARNESDYDNYHDLYEEVISFYNLQSSEKGMNSGLYEKDDISFVKTIISNMSEIIDMTIEECSIELTRNIKSSNFSTIIQSQERKELTEKIMNSILKSERIAFENKLCIDCEEYKEEGEVEYLKGGFFKINKKYMNYSDTFPLLKQYGVYNSWPEDRIVYKNKGISIVINHLDHLKFSFNYEKSENESKLSKELYSFYDLVDLIGKSLPYAFNEKFGFLSTFPTKSGNGLNFRLKIKVKSGLNKKPVVDAFSSLSRQFNNNYIIEENDVIDGNDDYSVLIISCLSTNVSFIQVLFEILGQKKLLF